MKFQLIAAVTMSSFLIGCASQENACEDVTLAAEQIQECQALQRQIANAKNQPLIRSELERRFQTDCIDVRYYRDEHTSAICGNKQQIEELIEEAREKQENESKS